MANFQIDRRFTGDVDALVERAKVAIRTHEIGDGVAMGKLDGDAVGGTFSVATLYGDVVGSYTVGAGGDISIEIFSKPMFVTEKAISDGVDEFLRSSS